MRMVRRKLPPLRFLFGRNDRPGELRSGSRGEDAFAMPPPIITLASEAALEI
jgi:hypothetical protein